MNAFMESARQKGLAVLEPSSAQLERGLELHRTLFACDTFSFLPEVWPSGLMEELNALIDTGDGARAWYWKSMMRHELSGTRDLEGAGEFVQALKASGLAGTVLTVAEGKSRAEDIERMSNAVHACRVLRRHLVQAGSVAQMRQAREEGRFFVVWSVNGPPCPGHMADAEEELEWIDTWYRLGVRLMHLTYNRRNVVGDGCMEPADGGLSEFGREMVKKLNETGIAVDVPHSGRRTTLEAAQLSERPIMASHTGCQAIFEHARAKSDEELKAIAETDGLVGIVGLPQFLGPDATIATLLDHVDYATGLIGADHVAIGTDHGYASPWPSGLKRYENARFDRRWWGAWKPQVSHTHASDEHNSGSLAWTNWPLYTVGLVTRGYSDDDIGKILGENLLRVLQANEPAGYFEAPEDFE